MVMNLLFVIVGGLLLLGLIVGVIVSAAAKK